MKKELLKQSHHVLISVTCTQTAGVSEPGGPGGADQLTLSQSVQRGQIMPITLHCYSTPPPPNWIFRCSDLQGRPWTKKICGGHVIPSFI